MLWNSSVYFLEHHLEKGNKGWMKSMQVPTVSVVILISCLDQMGFSQLRGQISQEIL